jgi:NAD-reducing hydrogenase small subunit
VHQVVNVDLFLPGCPPPADAIYSVLSDILAGRQPEPLKLTRFGA